MRGETLVYRMVHVKNLGYIIRHGMWARSSGVSDPNFIPIGNTDVIAKRKEYDVGITPPGGVLSDYVPFYFAGHSPMLLNIVTGYNVTRFTQKEIAFVVCEVGRLTELGLQWCFTDGHAIKAITRYFNSLPDIDKLDWETIKAQYWKDSEEDTDRQRKKMAEFLVRNHVPAEAIRCIVVRDDETRAAVQSLCNEAGVEMPVYIDNTNRLYYPSYD